MALEIPMADALADQLGKQLVQRLQFVLGRIAAFHIRSKALDDVRPRQVLGDQVGTAAQPQEPFLQHRQRLGCGKTQEGQAVAFAPGVPGAAWAPETLEPMGKALDVVTLDHQRPAGHVDLGHARRATGLVQVPLVEQRIGLLQHRHHGGFFFAADRTQAKSAAHHTEQRAFAAGLVQVVSQAPGTDFTHLLFQGLHWQGVFAVGQQVIHQQFFGKRLKVLRQLGEEHPEVFQYSIA